MSQNSNHKIRIRLNAILVLWTIAILVISSFIISYGTAEAANKKAIITPGKTNVYFRQSPGGDPVTDNGSSIMLNGGHELTVTSTKNSDWYKVNLTYNKKEYTGYISSMFITFVDESGNSESGSTSGDTDFENYMTAQGFPESYKAQLRDLHAAHPNWVFTAYQTGLDWKDVVANEVNIQGRVNNMVEGTSSAPHYNWRSTTVGYDIKNDKWSSYDGSTWFASSDELTTYYLDPRVYLYEQFVFAFETLSYDDAQTESGVNSILYGTFMYSTKPEGSTYTYAQLMLKAGKNSGVSPYHIASRIKQEIGAVITSGTNGKNATYPGIYNFYNIGAYASPEGNAITNGLKWASSGSSYGRPWTSPYKSILGGAEYIGKNYILVGQNTLYTQKFNVTYTSALYSHQYMGNVQAVSSESRKVYYAYRGAGTLDNVLTFSIPVYKNMPDTQVSKPSDSGNPNNYLSSLSVGSYSLSPAFAIGQTTDYTVKVPDSVSSITISALAVKSSASVSGTGKVNLSSGTNTAKINVTSESGNVRTYTLTIIRGNATTMSNVVSNNNSENSSSGSGNDSLTSIGSYVTDGTYISGVNIGTSVKSFKKKLEADNVTITNSSGVEKTSGDMATGDKVKVSKKTYQIVIYGDLNGDGKVSAIDLLKLQKHLMGNSSLSGASLEAANIKHKNSVSALDLLKLQKHLMGKETISQK